MPTIELTDEQAEELKNAIWVVMDNAGAHMQSNSPGDPDYIECEHRRSVLSDILHLLEIA